MDRVECLKAFLAVAEARSFIRASKKLRVSSSVITKRVQHLEAALGTRLFHRTTHHVTLSEFGEKCFHDVAKLVRSFDDFYEPNRPTDYTVSGPLRIKVPGVLALHSLSKAFARFQQQNPQIQLDIVVVDRPVNPLEEGFDIAVGISPPPYAGVFSTSLRPFKRICVASPAYIKRRGRPVRPHDLTNHDCLVIHQHGSFWSFKGNDAPVQVGVDSCFTANSVTTLLDGAISGIGIALIWEPLCRQAVKSSKLVPILEDYPAIDSWIAAQVPQDRVDSFRNQRLIETVRKALG